MRKNTDSVSRFPLNDTTHVRVNRNEEGIKEIRVVRKIGAGHSFISFSSLEDLSDFIEALERVERMFVS